MPSHDTRSDYAIVEALRRAPHPLSQREIAKATGFAYTTVGNYLSFLCSGGEIVRYGKGRRGSRCYYTLAKAAADA